MAIADVVVFTPPDLEPVLDALRAGALWVNLQPEVDGADLPESSSSGLFGLFGGRGPAVPFATWHPGERVAGIQHAAGPKVARRLDVPRGWRVTQDHSKRGVVVKVDEATTDEDVLQWLLRAGAELTAVPLQARWVAEVHR